MVSRIVLVWLLAALGLVGGLPAAAAGQGNVPVATLADGRVGQIHFESRTPAGYFALARREAAPGAVVVGTLRLPKDAIGRVPVMVIAHGCGGVDDSERSPRFERGLVPGRGCDMAVDLDHLMVARRGTGEDITAIAGWYGRDCLARGATIGGDGEARRRAPEDVAAFLRRVLKPETH